MASYLKSEGNKSLRRKTAETTHVWQITRFIAKMEEEQARVNGNGNGPQAIYQDEEEDDNGLRSESFRVTDEEGLQMFELRASITLKPLYGYAVVVVEHVGDSCDDEVVKPKCHVKIRSAEGFEMKPEHTKDGCKGNVLHESYFPKDSLRASNSRNGAVDVLVTVEMECDQLMVDGDMSWSSSALKEGYLGKKLWESRDLTGDVTLVCGDVSVRAHKLVLAVMSDTFAAMFSHKDIAESQSGVVKIKDMDPECLEEFVHCIYMDRLMTNDLSVSVLEGLLIAADKYFISSLKIRCEHELSKRLQVTNVCGTVILADLYNATFLKDFAIQYLSKNFKYVIKNPSSNWGKLPSDIAKKVLETLADK